MELTDSVKDNAARYQRVRRHSRYASEDDTEVGATSKPSEKGKRCASLSEAKQSAKIFLQPLTDFLKRQSTRRVFRCIFLALCVYILYVWIDLASSGYDSLSPYFDNLQNEVKAPVGTKSMTASVMAKGMMGDEWRIRWAESFNILVIIWSKDGSERFMNDPETAERGPVGQFLRSVVGTHLDCDSTDIEGALHCDSCSLNSIDDAISEVMDICGNSKNEATINETTIRGVWEVEEETSKTRRKWTERKLWRDTYEVAQSYFASREELGEEEARRRFVANDGSATLLRVVPRDYYLANYNEYYDNFLQDKIDDMFPPESPFAAEIISWPRLAQGASDGFNDDVGSGHFFILPLSWFILVYVCGPMASLVLITLPLSILATVKYLEQLREDVDYKFPAFSVSLWLVLEVALAIDYALFLLSRFSEEFESRRAKRAAGSRRRLRSGATVDIFPDTCTEDSSNAKDRDVIAVCLYLDNLYADGFSGIWKTIKTAGETIALSGLTLAGSFVGMIFVEDTNVRAVGLSCVIATLVTVLCNMTIVPSLLLLTLPLQPYFTRFGRKCGLLRKAICSRIVTACTHMCCTSFRGQIAHLPITGSTSSTSRARSVSMQPMMTNGDVGRGDSFDGAEENGDEVMKCHTKGQRFKNGFAVVASDEELEEDTKRVPANVKDDALRSNAGFWRRVGRFCQKHPWIAICLVLAAATPFVACLPFLTTSISFEMLMPTTNPTGVALQRVIDSGMPSGFANVIGIVTTPVGTIKRRSYYANQYTTGTASTGAWGGSCTCPDGQIYQVGDNLDGCGSLACQGGVSGECHESSGEWSHNKVICGTHVSRTSFDLVRVGVECKSSDTDLGNYASIQDCAHSCALTDGCRFFIYGKGEKSGNCYAEHTMSAECVEGWEEDLYDFYEIRTGSCTDNDAAVAAAASQLGLDHVTSCASAKHFCAIDQVKATCGCTCLDVTPDGDRTGSCYDDNATAVAIAHELGITISGCADAADLCDMSPQVAHICSCTCEGAALPPSPDGGGCIDNDDIAVIAAARLGLDISGCSDAVPLCTNPLVATTCACTCQGADDGGEGGSGGSCVDDDDAARAYAETLGYSISGCLDASAFCNFAQVRSTCPDTCGVCGNTGAATCVDSDVLIADSASTLGFKIDSCADAIYFCAASQVSMLCPHTCKSCPGDDANSTHGAVLNERHFDDVTKTVRTLLSIDERFHPRDIDAVAWFEGHAVSLTWALGALLANETAVTATQTRYRKHFYALQNGPMPMAMEFGPSFGTDMSLSVVRLRLPWNAMGDQFESWLVKARRATMQNVWDSETGVSVHFHSGLAFQLDDRALIYTKAPGIMIATVIVMVLMFSGCAFHSLVLGPRLLLTIVITLSTTYGACALWFNILHGGNGGDGIYWLAPVVCTPILIGLTLDYDLFLIGRVYEYRKSGYSTSDATILGLEKTGGIITTAGTIMLTAFFALLISSNPVVNQLGFILSFSVFVDTFIVRSIFVPAVMQVGVEWNWWPKRMPAVTRALFNDGDE